MYPPPPPPPRERARAEEVRGEKRESATDGRAPRLSFLALLWCPREAFCLTRGRAKRRQFIRRRGGYETVLNGKRFRRENERKRELGGNLEKKRARWIREQRTHFCAGWFVPLRDLEFVLLCIRTRRFWNKFEERCLFPVSRGNQLHHQIHPILIILK